MSDASGAAFKQELKALIVEVCEKSVQPDQISDDETLFGPQAPLQLDSLDGLQLSVALERKYGVRLTDSKEVRRVFQSIETLAAFLQPHLANAR